MARSDEEIVVGDPAAPPVESAPVASTRSVELVVYLCLLGVAALLAFDNWRTGRSRTAGSSPSSASPSSALARS